MAAVVDYTKKLSSRQTVKHELIRQLLDSLIPEVSSQPKTIDNENMTYMLETQFQCSLFLITIIYRTHL